MNFPEVLVSMISLDPADHIKNQEYVYKNVSGASPVSESESHVHTTIRAPAIPNRKNASPSPPPPTTPPVGGRGRGVGDFRGRNGTFCGRNEEKIPRPPKAGEKILRSCAVANAPPDVAKSHGRGRFLKIFAPAALLLGLLGDRAPVLRVVRPT